MTERIELGFKIAPHHIDWQTMTSIWDYADDSGVYAQGWNFDHFYPIIGDPGGDCLEAWVTLTALAERTSNIRIGTLVNGIHHRHPAIVAAMASTLDIVSGGRFELGLGAGWNEQESSAYGIDLGSLTDRFDRLDEAAEIIIALLSERETSYSGRYYELTRARNEPKGVQRPIPICIGGLGEKRTLRAVAKYANHWNLPEFDAEVYEHKRRVLARHCDAVGRDVDEIKVSAHVAVEPGHALTEIVEQVERQADAGLGQAILYFQPPVQLATVQDATEALKRRHEQL